jgi:uncharacterized membrane protein YidH (DUF202 family)
LAAEETTERRWILPNFIWLALVLLTFVILHTTILRTALSLFGLRQDVSQIVLVRDSCGNAFMPPVALTRSASDFPIFRSACDKGRDTQIWYTIPRGNRTGLFLNERLVDATDFSSTNLGKATLRLRKGTNRLVVLDEGSEARLPFATQIEYPRYTLPDRRAQGLIPPVTPNPTYPTSEIWVVLPDAYRAEQSLGLYRADDGTFSVAIASDCGLLPGTAEQDACYQRASESGVTSSGYAIAATKKEAPTATILKKLYRELTIHLEPDALRLEIRICLSKDLQLQSTFKDDQDNLTPQEVLRRVFGLSIERSAMFQVGDALTMARIVPRQGALGCFAYEGDIALDIGPIVFDPGNFLAMQGDRLTIENAGPLLESEGPLPEARVDENTVVWNGRYGETKGLRISDWGIAASAAKIESAKAENSSTILSLAFRISGEVPETLHVLSLGLAAALPVLVIALVGYFALQGADRTILFPVIALSIYVVTIAAQPLMLSAAQWILSLFPALRAPGGGVLRATAIDYIPLGVLAATLMTPVARHKIGGTSGLRTQDKAWLASFIRAIGFVVLASVTLTMLRHPNWIATIEQSVSQDTRPTTALLLMLTIWILVSTAYARWALRRFLRNTVDERSAKPGALIGALIVVILPVIPALTGATGLIGALSDTPHPVFEHWGAARVLGLSAMLLPCLGYLAVMTIFVHSYSVVLRRALSYPPEAQVNSNTLKLFAIVLATILAAPAFGPLANGSTAFGKATLQLLVQFHDIAVLAALTIPAVLFFRCVRRVEPGSEFAKDPSLELMLSATLAGYVTSISAHDGDFFVNALAAAVAGFGVYMVGLQQDVMKPPSSSVRDNLGNHLVAAIDDNVLLDKRLTQEEVQYAEGEIDWNTFQQRKSEVDKIRSQKEIALGCELRVAKAQLLNNGPGGTPLSNATLGMGLGVIYALLFDVTRAIEFGPIGQHGGQWWVWLLRGADATGVELSISEGGAFSQLQSIVRALLFWPILGFVFGGLFHRLHGNDGFTKGAVLSAILVIPVAIDGMWSGGSQIDLETFKILLSRILLIGLFLLAVGALAFDLASIHRQGASWTSLRSIYGVPALLSYATIIGIASALQSAFALVTLAGAN